MVEIITHTRYNYRMNDAFIQAFHESGMSVYRLSRQSGVPYTTVYELVSRKKNINHRPVETIKRIAAVLGRPVEQLLNPVHYMDGISGKLYGISFTWRYEGKMVLHIKDGKEKTVIATGLQMTDTDRRSIYEGVADAYIQQYLKQKAIQEHMEKAGHVG